MEAARERQQGRFAGTDIASKVDMRPAPTGIVTSSVLTLCALISFPHPKGLIPKSADRQT
ncbi:MAG TPA: hypothetical protein DCL08_01970 [Anaerolineaceae bacterium]|nr:hypothetical protein [Anaerolineaceae bacterium]